MLLNNQLALDVLAAWASDQNHPHRGQSNKPIPSEQDLAILLDTMFRASLLHEEGKPVSTSVAWVSRSDFENHEIGRMRESRLTLEFDEPIAFEDHNLAKLSGIVNGKTGTLLACRMESSAYIWGVCYFMRGTGPIGEIPAIAMEVRHPSPDYPTVTVTGVGSMQITRGGTVIGRVEGEKQQLDFSRLGTRHNSALNFVGSIEGAVAFVASSDGPIRALVRSTEERIWYWPDCRVSMFAK